MAVSFPLLLPHIFHKYLATSFPKQNLALNLNTDWPWPSKVISSLHQTSPGDDCGVAIAKVSLAGLAAEYSPIENSLQRKWFLSIAVKEPKGSAV